MKTIVTIGERTFIGTAFQLEPLPQLWQVLHDVSLGPLWRPNLPEVHPLFPNHFCKFNEAWQRFTFEKLNSHLAPKEWTAVYSYQRFITNNQGFGMPGDPRANFVTGEHTDKELPKVEALICGGALLTGVAFSGKLAVQVLDWREPPASLEWLLKRPWLYFHAITVDQGGIPRMFPQGHGKPILIPLIADPYRYPVITIPLSKLRKLDMTKPLPDPYTIYRQ